MWWRKFCTTLALGLGLGVTVAAAQERPIRDADRPWIAGADSLASTGDLESAAAAYRELTLQHASDPALWLRLALMELQLRRTGAALEAARTAHDLAPSDPDTYLVLAQAEAASGDPEFGVATLRRALERFPTNLELLAATAQVSVELGRIADAVGLMRQLVRLAPDDAAVHQDLIRLLISAEDYAGAESEIRSRLDRGGDEAVLLALLGKTQLLAGDVVASEATFLRSLEVQETAEGLGGLGAIRFVDGDHRGAADLLQRATELDPYDADLFFNLGNAWTRIDQLEEAEGAYRRSLQLDPRAATTHMNLGRLLLARLDVTGAIGHFQRATSLDAALPAPYLHLARIYSAKYQYQPALDNYREYSSRVGDANEAARIEGVIADIERRQAEAVAARARGEIHLLQARLSSVEVANHVIQRVRAGEDFYAIAAALSEVADVAGVDVGFLDPATMHDDFRAPIDALAVGEMTAPLEGPVGFFVFYRVE